MKQHKRLLQATALSVLLLLSGCGDTTSSPAMTDSNTTPHFSYEGETGPAHWYTLSDDWKTCKNGLEFSVVEEGKQHQSPVNIEGTAQDGNFTLNYNRSMEFKMVNNGHSVEFEVEDTNSSSSITIDKKKYTLKQFHFHYLSEHLIVGEHTPMEGHFVNVAEDGSIAVIGVFIDESNVTNELNSELLKAFASEIPAEGASNEDLIHLNPLAILPMGKVFSYSGSLTTPPCTEGVAWNVYEKHINLNTETINKFKSHYSNNYRPVTGILQ